MKILIVILVSLSFFISLPLFAQSSFKNKGKRASLVNVAKVQYFDMAEKTETIGRLVAVNPTIISFPLSIFACLFAAACSILIFGIPNSIALIIPP